MGVVQGTILEVVDPAGKNPAAGKASKNRRVFESFLLHLSSAVIPRQKSPTSHFSL